MKYESTVVGTVQKVNQLTTALQQELAPRVEELAADFPVRSIEDKQSMLCDDC